MIAKGLEAAWEGRYQKMEVESDSLKAINMTHNFEPHPIDTTGFPVISDIILKCKNLIRMPWTCSLKHIGRNANGCVDALAKFGHKETVMFVKLDSPPPLVSDLIIKEI